MTETQRPCCIYPEMRRLRRRCRYYRREMLPSSCWRSHRCRCGRGRQCRDHCDAYVFRAGATRGERNGPAAEQAQMAQRTRHGRPGGKWGAPQSAWYGHATGGLSAYYPGRIFHRHRHLSGPDFQDLVRLFPTWFLLHFFRALINPRPRSSLASRRAADLLPPLVKP